MPFGICTKPLKDDMTKDLLILVEIPDKSSIKVTLSKDATGLDCLESVTKELGLYEVRSNVSELHSFNGSVVAEYLRYQLNALWYLL